MASTQNLTELPIIQATGMDYSSVIAQIREIIESNSNWASNWTQFYNSEAGTLLIQLMAWICDNLAVRQDLLYNEQYLATATSDASKYRLLKQIGYNLRSKKATVLPISIEFKNILEKKVNLSNVRDNPGDFSEIKSAIFKFYGQDKNGKNIPFEILKVDEEGNPDYTYPIVLDPGEILYTKDSNGNKLVALQGNTTYREFTSNTSDGPIFELDSEIDVESLKVYSKEGVLFKRVENFLDTDVTQGNLICYLVEMNENGNYQIRFPSRDLVTYNNETLEDRLYVAGEKICVFFRTCAGQDANIPENFISISENVEDIDGDSQQIIIANIMSGYNGLDIENLDSAVRNAPLTLTSLNRAVTSEDYNRILRRNTMVLNSKTFTPDNMPGSFEKYYGRKINPHEAFSFIVLNKEINKIPNEKLNYYPWIETNKNHVLNEKYIFGDASLNNFLNKRGIYNNLYIQDNYNEYKGFKYNSIYDRGQWYSKFYDITKNDQNYRARMITNAIIYNTNNIFGDIISSEKNSEDYELKIKLHIAPTSELYIKNIIGIDNTTNNLTTNNNIIENEVNATYTAMNDKDVIDCKGYKYIKFVLDDLFTITVDLHAEAKNLYDAFKDIKPSWTPDKENIEYYDNYYLYLDNVPKTDNDSEYVSQQLAKYGETKEYYKTLYAYHNSKTYANYRKGIVQLIREALKEIVNYTVEIDYDRLSGVLATYKIQLGSNFSIENLCKKIIEEGELVQTINDYTFIYKITDNEIKDYVVILYKTEEAINSLGVIEEKITLAKILKIEENNNSVGVNDLINETEEVDITNQQLMYNSMFGNNTSSFADLNLQIEDENEQAFLRKEYIASTDNLIDYYTPEEKKDFYRIRINNRILAVRLDAYSIVNAHNFYKRLSAINDPVFAANGTYNSSVYDYFPYFGKGDMKFGLQDKEVIRYEDGSGRIYKYQYDKIQGAAFNSIVNATLDKIYNSGFSKIKLGEDSNSAAIDPDLSIHFNSTKDNPETENIEYVEFTLRTLVNTLEYIFSPLNIDKDTIFEFKDGEWYDLKTDDINDIKRYYGKEELTEDEKLAYRIVLDGALRIRNIKKGNFPTNNILNLVDRKYTNEYESGYEYDLRFEAFNKEEVNISSVSESEISSANMQQIPLFNKNTEDLFEKLTGYRKNIILKTSNYVDNIDNTVSCRFYNEPEDPVGKGTLIIASQSVGERSSVYFIKTAKLDGRELINELGLLDGFAYSYNIDDRKYGNTQRSIKSYGIKRIELYIGDKDGNYNYNIYSDGAPNIDVQDITGIKTESKGNTISLGDILYTSNDINRKDADNVYISYVLSSTPELKINKQNNFYYSSNKESNEYAKPPIIGIEGESVYYNQETGTYYIDRDKSDFEVKITNQQIDTNSFYSIEENTYEDLKVIKNKPVKIIGNSINGYDLSDEKLYTFSGLAYGINTELYTIEKLKAAANMQVPLIFSVDNLTKNCPQNGQEFVYSSNYSNVLAVNPGITYSTNGYNIYQIIYTKAKNSSNEFLHDNCYSFATMYRNENNKIIFNGITYTNDGNITFYYPDRTAFSSGLEDLNITTYSAEMTENHLDLSIKLFYKMLFGTNKTNPELYNLFPKEEMIKLNSEDIVCTLNEDSDEFFYCPTKFNHLKFIYRGFVDEYKTVSKYGDYYIDCENIYDGFKGGYNFYIKKTDNSDFPDKEFYLHFVNDRTYEPDRLTEEDKIKNYMKKYQIAGTELNLLKPYFKTFDLVGSVKYNANYDLATIKAGVENALKKYKLTSVRDIEIGNNVYRSDVFKTVLSVEGVLSFDLSYFGYDNMNKDKYPDQKYSLNISSQSDSKIGAEFYIVSILAESNGKHGAVITYEKADVSID